MAEEKKRKEKKREWKKLTASFCLLEKPLSICRVAEKNERWLGINGVCLVTFPFLPPSIVSQLSICSKK